MSTREKQELLLATLLEICGTIALVIVWRYALPTWCLTSGVILWAIYTIAFIFGMLSLYYLRRAETDAAPRGILNLVETYFEFKSKLSAKLRAVFSRLSSRLQVFNTRLQEQQRGLLVIVTLFTLGLCALSTWLGPLGKSVVPLPTIKLPADLIPIGPFHIPNTLLTTLLVDLFLIAIMLWGTRHLRRGDLAEQATRVPRGLQNALEWVIETIQGLLNNVLGESTSKELFPLLATIFIFLVAANWVELIPGVESIGLIERVEEGTQGYALRPIGGVHYLVAQPGDYTIAPFFRAPATDINTPLALALIAVTVVQIYGIRKAGLRNYLSRFFNLPALLRGGLMGVILFFVSLIEALSEVAKVISFTFRLFGNILAGSILLAVIIFLAPFVVPIIFYGLEAFVGVIQAFVFMMLTAAFVAIATTESGESE